MAVHFLWLNVGIAHRFALCGTPCNNRGNRGQKSRYPESRVVFKNRNDSGSSIVVTMENRGQELASDNQIHFM